MNLYVVCLIFGSEQDYTLVLNSDCASIKDAQTLAFDRKANGQAFPNERVMLMDRAEFNRRTDALCFDRKI